MFGLSTREKLISLMKIEYANVIPNYENDILQFLHTCKNYNNEENEQMLTRIRKNYLDSAGNAIISKLRSMSPQISVKLDFMLINPSSCGYDIADNEIDNGFSGGMMFAMCYKVISGKIAKPKDCLLVNHFIDNLLNIALEKIDT